MNREVIGGGVVMVVFFLVTWILGKIMGFRLIFGPLIGAGGVIGIIIGLFLPKKR